jgi:hypothetical protein
MVVLAMVPFLLGFDGCYCLRKRSFGETRFDTSWRKPADKNDPLLFCGCREAGDEVSRG